MQTMVIEFARNVCGLADADSTEFNPATPHRVIYKLRELKGVDELGGTMRLGAYPASLKKAASPSAPTASTEISERHRHRYEFNREFEDVLTAHGLRLTGQTPDGVYVEICEIAGPSVVPGLPVSSRIQVEAARTASVVHRFLGAALQHREQQACAHSKCACRSLRTRTPSKFDVGTELGRSFFEYRAACADCRALRH